MLGDCQIPLKNKSRVLITSITRSFHISKLLHSRQQKNQNLYIRLSLAKREQRLASESRIYKFYDKKVDVCHPLCHKLEMWKLLIIFVIIKLYARIGIFKKIWCVHLMFHDY